MRPSPSQPARASSSASGRDRSAAGEGMAARGHDNAHRREDSGACQARDPFQGGHGARPGPHAGDCHGTSDGGRAQG